jgi:2-C-methyl-D-erythritol 4-phosphate cytidylyltransferase
VREDECLAAAVVLASGAGVRVGGEVNKVYLPLAGRSMLAWSLRTLAGVPGVGVLVLVVRPQDREQAETIARTELAGCVVEIVHGGVARQDSELMALRHLRPRIAAGQIDVVLMHDAARPLVTRDLAAAVLHTARRSGGAVPGVPRDGLLQVSEDGTVAQADLGTLMAMQTPQGFLAAPLLTAYEQAAADGFIGTDTAACVQRYSDVAVRCIPGDDGNIKITYPHDLVIAVNSLTAAQPSGASAGSPGRKG